MLSIYRTLWPAQAREGGRIKTGYTNQMTTIVKTKTPLTVPQAVRRQAGFKAGDEYTPEQRRIIDARLADAEKGPYYGPFKDGAEVAAFLLSKKR